MPHKETNPAALDSRNDRRHITTIALLCVFVILGGAAVQAYRVHRAGWIPDVSVVSLTHGGTIESYETKLFSHFRLFRDDQGTLRSRNPMPNSYAPSFFVQTKYRGYNHPFRKTQRRPTGDLRRGETYSTYTTIRIDSVLASDTIEHPDVLFVEDHPKTVSGSYGDGLRVRFIEIQRPYSKEILKALDAFFIREHPLQKGQLDPLYTVPPIVRHDGIAPSLPARPTRIGVRGAAAMPASAHHYVHLEFGTLESPLTLYDWIDGAKIALIYVVAPIILLDLVGYWGIYRMTGIRRRKLRKIRGECIRCGYPLIDGLCCECGLRVVVDTDEAAIS